MDDAPAAGYVKDGAAPTEKHMVNTLVLPQ